MINNKSNEQMNRASDVRNDKKPSKLLSWKRRQLGNPIQLPKYKDVFRQY